MLASRTRSKFQTRSSTLSFWCDGWQRIRLGSDSGCCCGQWISRLLQSHAGMRHSSGRGATRGMLQQAIQESLMKKGFHWMSVSLNLALIFTALATLLMEPKCPTFLHTTLCSKGIWRDSKAYEKRSSATFGSIEYSPSRGRANRRIAWSSGHIHLA